MAHLTAVFIKPDNSFNMHCIRELTSEQSAELEDFLAEFIKLRQRFTLLHVLDENHEALNSFISQLRAAGRYDANNTLSEANRHLMNYLSAAYSLRQHLGTALKRDFGRKSEQCSKYQTFLHLLEQKCFDYAFIQDFRNFVQHCGFPVGHLQLTREQTGNVVTINYAKADLLNEYDKWEKSDLRNRPETEFDLLLITQRHHRVVLNEFPVVIHASYGTNLDRIESFFLCLQAEARKIDQNAVAKLVTELPANPEQGRITFRDIPQNPLAELGLSRKEATSSQPNPQPTPGIAIRSTVSPPATKPQTPKPALSLISYRTEEHDRYFDVQKHDVLGFHPDMVDLLFDPFPDAKSDDVVHKALMGRELVIFARFKASPDAIHLGMAIELNGHKFAVNQVKLHYEAESDQGTFDVEASEWMSYIEPVKLIANLRKHLAQNRR